MEYKEFIRKFVPDCENRLYKWSSTGGENNFCALVFSEALANYTALICEKQREECAQAYFDYDEDNYDGSFDMENVSDAIANAPQPKIDDLCEQ